jgi:hypothetical protein
VPAISFAISGSSAGHRIGTPSEAPAPVPVAALLLDVELLGAAAPVPAAAPLVAAVTVAIVLWMTPLLITLLLIALLLALLGRAVAELFGNVAAVEPFADVAVVEPFGNVAVAEPAVLVAPFGATVVPAAPAVVPVSGPVICAPAGAPSGRARTKAAASTRIAINPCLLVWPATVPLTDMVAAAATSSPGRRTVHGRAHATGALCRRPTFWEMRAWPAACARD